MACGKVANYAFIKLVNYCSTMKVVKLVVINYFQIYNY